MKRLFIGLLLAGSVALHGADVKKIVLLAGTPSHGPREHEFNAGCLLLQKCLASQPGVEVVVNQNGWPKDEHMLDGAAAVFIYCDGGDGHLAIQGDHLQKLGALMKKGVGLGCAHYGVEVPKEKGGAELLAWTGGYFEVNWSVNPTWTADYTELPKHAITRGVHPFSINDEWYFHMRFPEGMKNVTPILSAIAPDSTMDRPDDPHGGNPAVRVEVKNRVPQVMMWAIERPDGGRGFGFTGGHFHKNWANDDFRKLVLNAILWSAKVKVPKDGFASTVTPEDLKQNLDPK
jgi:type 1 glutamine amidotransferase